MPNKDEEEERRRKEIAAVQAHNDRGDGCGKKIGIVLFLFSFACLIAEGARVMAENNIPY